MRLFKTILAFVVCCSAAAAAAGVSNWEEVRRDLVKEIEQMCSPSSPHEQDQSCSDDRLRIIASSLESIDARLAAIENKEGEGEDEGEDDATLLETLLPFLRFELTLPNGLVLTGIAIFCAGLWSFVRSEKQLLRSLCSKTENSVGHDFNVDEFVAYRVDYWFSSSSASKPVALLIMTIILIAVGGFMYAAVDGIALSAAMWQSMTFIVDGPYADEEDIGSRFVAFILTMGGMLVFALMIGLISDGIGDRVDDLKKGKSRVIESGHTVILGWGDKLIPLIVQIALANDSEGGGVITVLADMDKEEMEEFIEEQELELMGTEVICRSGSPLLMPALKQVAAPTARSVIVLSDSSLSADMSDTLAVRIVLALRGLDAPRDGHIVVEMCDLDNRDLVTIIGQDKVETVVAHDIVGRLMLQCARQQGLAEVLGKLLGFEGNEFYLKEWPELVGATFGDLMFRFPDAVPLGISRAGSDSASIEINPSDDARLGPGDRVLVIAEDDDTYSPVGGNDMPRIAFSRPPLPGRSAARQPPEHLLFCGWRRDIHDLILELDKQVPQGSVLTMLNVVPLSERKEKLTEDFDENQLQKLRLNHVEGNPCLRRDLALLPLANFNSIMILASEDCEGDMAHADSLSLTSLLLIKQLCAMQSDDEESDGGSVPMVISEILDSRTRSLVAVAGISDYVLSNELVSMGIAMVAEQREVNAIFQELFSADGDELYLRAVTLYIEPNQRSSFWYIMRCARMRGEVAIGYRQGSAPPVINPEDKTEAITWSVDDVLIVCAKD